MGAPSKEQDRYGHYWICFDDGYGHLIDFASRTLLLKLGIDPELCIKISQEEYDYINENSVK